MDSIDPAPPPAAAHDFDPLRVRRWDGPSPDPSHRLLLSACLAEPAKATAAWAAWIADRDFDHEDPASYELGSFAVARLGSAAGEGDATKRLRGWSRRAWFVSELAIGAARRVARDCERRAISAVALGDLAGWLADDRFEDRRLPVRTIEIEIDPASREAIPALLAVAAEGAAGDAMRLGRLPVRVAAAGSARVPADCRRETELPGLAAPADGERLRRLAELAWCWRPPGRLRWMLEAAAILPREPSEILARSVAEGALRQGSAAAVQAALRELAAFVDSPALAAIDRELRRRGIGLRSRLRAAAHCRPPHSWWRRVHARLGGCRRRLTGR